MNDEYQDYPIKLFIDSNVVLEALPLEDLPWAEIDPIGPILIMIPPTVLREVDSKKRDGRLAVRARSFNRLISPIAHSGQSINLIPSIPRVDIAIARCSRIDWDSYDDLDPSQGDAKIIAEVLNVRGVPFEQRCVISQDTLPLFMAQNHGLKTHHVSESWLPQPEPSPLEKENAKLKRQISEYAKTEPNFKIKLETPSAPVELYKLQDLTVEEETLLTLAVLSANPKPPQQKRDPWDTFNYDTSLDGRYLKYESKTVPDFVKNYRNKLEILYGQIPFTLTLKNIGTVRADHVNIEVQIVGGWFNEKPISTGTYPPAPMIKNPLHAPHISPSLFHQQAQKIVGRHEFKINKPKKSPTFTAQCEDFRHGNEWIYSGVAWLDPCQNSDAVITVKITAANQHGEYSEFFKLEKLVTFKNVFDLVDIKNGKLINHFHVKNLIEKALSSPKNFDLVEWDHSFDSS